jgi:hypothetical protein
MEFSTNIHDWIAFLPTLTIVGVSFVLGRLWEYLRVNGTNDSRIESARLKRQLLASHVQTGVRVDARHSLSGALERPRTHTHIRAVK